MKPGSTPYKAGEPVWVNRQDGVFARATLASNAERRGHHTEIKVAYLVGGEQIVGIERVFRDSFELHVWMNLLAQESQLLRDLTEVCKINGFTYGGKACQRTRQWAVYQENKTHAQAAASAVFALHPYER